MLTKRRPQDGAGTPSDAASRAKRKFHCLKRPQDPQCQSSAGAHGDPGIGSAPSVSDSAASPGATNGAAPSPAGADGGASTTGSPSPTNGDSSSSSDSAPPPTDTASAFPSPSPTSDGSLSASGTAAVSILPLSTVSDIVTVTASSASTDSGSLPSSTSSGTSSAATSIGASSGQTLASHGLSHGATAGIVLAIIGALGLVAAFVFLLHRRRRRAARTAPSAEFRAYWQQPMERAPTPAMSVASLPLRMHNYDAEAGPPPFTPGSFKDPLFEKLSRTHTPPPSM